MRGGKVGRDGTTSEEYGAGREGRPCGVEIVEEGLVAEAEVVLGVLNTGEFGPGHAKVDGLVNGKVDIGWLWGVILPGCEECSVGKLDCPGVEGSRAGVGGWGLEDGIVVEVREGRAGLERAG